MLYAIPFLFLENNLVSSAKIKCVLKLKQIHFVQKLQIFVFSKYSQPWPSALTSIATQTQISIFIFI